MILTRSMMIIAACGLLAGCADVKQEIGLGRQSPDEFAVVTRAPLSLPPSFELRPPEPGASRPQEATTRDAAKDLVFAQPEQAAQKDKSSAEYALLAKAGADQADPNIRDVVSRELGQVDVNDPYVGRRLLFWKDAPTADANIIDPVEEAKRLKKTDEAEISEEALEAIDGDGQE